MKLKNFKYILILLKLIFIFSEDSQISEELKILFENKENFKWKIKIVKEDGYEPYEVN